MITGSRVIISTCIFANLIKKLMKKIALAVIALSAFITVTAQPGKTTKPTTPVKTTTPAGPVLKTSNDSLSYILGEVAAFNLVQQGLGDVKINGTYFMKAINDILGKKTTLIDDVTANGMLNNYMFKQMELKVQPAIEEGKKFLAQNKLKPGVITTASGLQYEVIKEGTGIKPAIVDTFVAQYRGTFLNGTEFDASKPNQPLVYPVNKVVRGWTEALQLMSVGSTYKLYVPYDLGYGTADNGRIPGGSLLVFELELIDIRKKQ